MYLSQQEEIITVPESAIPTIAGTSQLRGSMTVDMSDDREVTLAAAETAPSEEVKMKPVPLIPPSTLFQPIEYPALHIFVRRIFFVFVRLKRHLVVSISKFGGQKLRRKIYCIENLTRHLGVKNSYSIEESPENQIGLNLEPENILQMSI